MDRWRGSGPRQYFFAALAATALLAVVALVAGGLGSYVAFDGSPVGVKPEPDARPVVATSAPRAVRAEASQVAAAPAVTPRSAAIPSASEPTAPEVETDGDPDADAGNQADPETNDPDSPAQTGEPPVDVEPTTPPADPEPVPVDTRLPVETPVAEVPPAPAPVPMPATAPPGPLTATTTGLDETLGSLGIDLPVTELTEPVTKPADELLGLLSGSSHG